MSKRQTKETTLIPATGETPAMSNLPVRNAGQLTEKQLDRQQRHLTSAEFRKQLSLLAADSKDMLRMAYALGKAGREGIKLENGDIFTKKELDALQKRYTKKLKSLAKNYSAAARRKPKVAGDEGAGDERRTGGFGQPVYLEQPLVDFLSQAKLGVLKDGTSVSDAIAPFLEQGVLSRGILTQLMTFYKENNPEMNFMVEEQADDGSVKEYKRLRATKDMKKYLGPYLTSLETADKKNPKVSKKTGKVSTPFNRDNFVYNQLSRITNKGVVDKTSLDAEQEEYLSRDDVQDMLTNLEQQFKANK